MSVFYLNEHGQSKGLTLVQRHQFVCSFALMGHCPDGGGISAIIKITDGQTCNSPQNSKNSFFERENLKETLQRWRRNYNTSWSCEERRHKHHFRAGWVILHLSAPHTHLNDRSISSAQGFVDNASQPASLLISFSFIHICGRTACHFK